jgi:hypothetical protein
MAFFDRLSEGRAPLLYQPRPGMADSLPHMIQFDWAVLPF